MPLLMHEVWEKILIYAYEPRPMGVSGAKREACRQNTLATLMRTSIFLNLLAAPILYHSPIIDDPYRFIFGYNESIPVHPSIQTKAELFAHVRQLHLEYPDLTTHPTYYQLMQFTGSYWHDVGLDRVTLKTMPFERYHEYTNRLRIFLRMMGCPPGTPEGVAEEVVMGGAEVGGKSAAAGGGSGGEGKATGQASIKVDTKASKKSTKSQKLVYAFEHRAFPNLLTISLCSILGHPTDDWMPKTDVDAEIALVKVQRDLLWRWIKSCGAKHVCAHNGESALGLPWDEAVDKAPVGVESQGADGSMRADGNPLSIKTKSGMKTIKNAHAPAYIAPPAIRIHLNEVDHPPVMILNAKMTWDMPHFPGRHEPLLYADANMANALQQPARDSGPNNVSASDVAEALQRTAHESGRDGWRVSASTDADGATFIIEDLNHPLHARNKAAFDVTTNAMAGPGPSSGAGIVNSAIKVNGKSAKTQKSMATQAPDKDRSQQLDEDGWNPGNWEDTSVLLERALYLMFHQGHLGITRDRPGMEQVHANAKALSEGKNPLLSTSKTGDVQQGRQHGACPTHGDACSLTAAHRGRAESTSKKTTVGEWKKAAADGAAAALANSVKASKVDVVETLKGLVATHGGAGITINGDIYPIPASSGSVSSRTAGPSASSAPSAKSTSSPTGAGHSATIAPPTATPKPDPVADRNKNIPSTRIRTTTAKQNRIDLSIFISPSHISSSGRYYEHASPEFIASRPDMGIRPTTEKEQRAMARRAQATVEKSLGYGNLDKEGAGKGKERDRIAWRSAGESGVCEACGWFYTPE